MLQFDIKPEEVDKASPNRPLNHPPDLKPRPQPVEPTDKPTALPHTSA
ncbi:uncharacterized protein G2W53_002547 [Senna tora]|uniref:Uncharacterized protein n=1 Tax=Senna tora TaxID=362788 RepID=A0A834X8N4_9FABA|nr:uncharacterized protein G2W53_002547 [Senna tora]